MDYQTADLAWAAFLLSVFTFLLMLSYIVYHSCVWTPPPKHVKHHPEIRHIIFQPRDHLDDMI